MNSKINPNESKIFIADAGDSIAPHSNIWLWTDSPSGDGNLQSSELHLLGTLEGLTKDHLMYLTSANFVV